MVESLGSFHNELEQITSEKVASLASMGKGALIGGGIGVALGGLAGYAGGGDKKKPTPKDRREAALYAAISGGVAGALLGASVAAVRSPPTAGVSSKAGPGTWTRKFNEEQRAWSRQHRQNQDRWDRAWSQARREAGEARERARQRANQGRRGQRNWSWVEEEARRGKEDARKAWERAGRPRGGAWSDINREWSRMHREAREQARRAREARQRARGGQRGAGAGGQAPGTSRGAQFRQRPGPKPAWMGTPGSKEEAKKRWRKKFMDVHPDRARTPSQKASFESQAKKINAEWDAWRASPEFQGLKTKISAALALRGMDADSFGFLTGRRP